MTTVVPTSEEDPVLSVVRFTAEMSWAEAGPEVAEPQVSSLCLEAQEFMIAGRWLDLASLMITSADLVFSKASEKDLECIFTIICNLVKKPESLDELLEMAKLLSSKIAQQPNDKPALRLKILFNLYNLLEHPYSRFYVYMKALKLATDGKVIEHIIPSFKKIDSFLKEWDLGVNPQISSSPSSNLPCISRSVKPLFNLCNAAKFASRHLVTRLLIPRLRFSSRPKSSSRNGWDFEATKWVCNCSPQSIDLHILLLVNIMCHSPLPPFLNIIVFHCTNKGLKNHVADGRTLLGCFADCYGSNPKMRVFGKKVIKALHGYNGCLGVARLGSGSSGVWGRICSINKATEKVNIPLECLFSKNLGKGSNTRFWTEPWCSNQPLSILFPRLFALEENRDCWIVDRVSSTVHGYHFSWNWRRQLREGRETGDLAHLRTLCEAARLNDAVDRWL